jgi:hypothetical protein
MRFWNRFRLRMRGGRLESDLCEEIRLHREMLEEQFVGEGMSRSDASRAAARQLGNPGVVTDLSRDEWAFPRLDAIWTDVKFAWRLMLRYPLLTGAAVLTVAFGVGANTTILSVLETLLLNPLGMQHTEKVMVARVHIEKLHMLHSTVSGVEFREIQSMQDTFTAAAAVESRAWTYQEGGQATRLIGRAVTPDFFRVFVTSPALGRFLTPEDSASVVLSHGMWQTHFGGDESVIGRAITLDDKPYRIVGVARADFRFPADAMAWAPLTLTPDRLQRRGWNMNLTVFARLRDGIMPAQAAGRVNRYVAGLIASGNGDLGKSGYGFDLDPFAVYLAGELPAVMAALGSGGGGAAHWMRQCGGFVTDAKFEPAAGDRYPAFGGCNSLADRAPVDVGELASGSRWRSGWLDDGQIRNAASDSPFRTRQTAPFVCFVEQPAFTLRDRDGHSERPAFRLGAGRATTARKPDRRDGAQPAALVSRHLRSSGGWRRFRPGCDDGVAASQPVGGTADSAGIRGAPHHDCILHETKERPRIPGSSERDASQ